MKHSYISGRGHKAGHSEIAALYGILFSPQKKIKVLNTEMKSLRPNNYKLDDDSLSEDLFLYRDISKHDSSL